MGTYTKRKSTQRWDTYGEKIYIEWGHTWEENIHRDGINIERGHIYGDEIYTQMKYIQRGNTYGEGTHMEW